MSGINVISSSTEVAAACKHVLLIRVVPQAAGRSGLLIIIQEIEARVTKT
jgi:hypothetical protein